MHTANTYAAVGAIDAYGGGCAPVNDTYLTSWGTPTCYGGMARMMTVVNDQRARSTNTLLVDAGSSLATSLYYYVHGPSIVAAYYAQLGYDFVHFQLEDFFLLVETVIEFMQVANAGALSMQFVASNLEGFNNDTRANGTFIAKWAFKSFAGGEKVGYAATVAKDLELMMRNPRDIHTTDEAAALLVAVIALMNKGANKIVASVSSNATAELVLANVPGIDILIVPGGQLQANDLSDIRSSAVGPYPMVRNTAWEQPVLVVSSGTYGRLVGVLDVTFDDYGVITSWSGDSVLMDESVVANTSVQAQLAADYAQVEAYFAQTVGWSAVDLSADAKCFFAECTIGDWAADSLRSFAMPTWGGNVQVGLINGGSINSALPQGPVTLGMQQSAFPFGTNALYTYLLKGRVLVAALENGLSLADDPTLELSAGAGRFLQVSGLRFSWNPKEAVGYRVIDAYVEVRPGSWALLDPGATYNVSSIDWLVVYGGDGFTMIADNATHVFKNGDNMNAVLLDALAKNVTDVPTGRITTTAATRRACIADDGSTCSNNGYCLTGACVCTVAGTNSASLCALSATHGSPGSSSETVLAIALGVSLPVTALLVLGVLTALLIFLLARRRREPDSWEIDVAELELGDQLGAGGFGEVYRAVWKGTDVAVKVVSANNAGKAAWDSFKQEVSVMTALRHPNVVLFMAASTKPPKMCIVMELMELGSLYELIHNELLPAIPLPLCLKMAYQAAKGMHFLHSSGIVHRDLKSLNLLLDSKWNLKVQPWLVLLSPCSSTVSLLPISLPMQQVSDFGLTTFKADLKRATGDDVQGGVHTIHIQLSWSLYLLFSSTDRFFVRSHRNHPLDGP
jgi:2',3'-cyclic-nucleotide 2'-phosphodiesterase (5'-nucleotidase family)